MNCLAKVILVSFCLQLGCKQNETHLPVSGDREITVSERGEQLAPIGVTATEILGNADYPAFSYGGYRKASRNTVPRVAEIKEDMSLLSAMGIKLLRTFNTQQYTHTANLLEAIRQLQQTDPEFEMYVMLGAWVECEGAWGPNPNHDGEHIDNNAAEIEAAVQLATDYPEIVKMIAVGNEAMAHWATSYFVRPRVILKWVNHLQRLKTTGSLPSDIWITSSDNFACWGGGDASYHTDDLNKLIKAVDFVSMHTYPFHDTHYNPQFWGVPITEEDLSVTAKADAAMMRARDYAVAQYEAAKAYMTRLDIDKPIHIGETGWASNANASYGKSGSCAADEYKQKSYYEAIRQWTCESGLTCFYFEAFDEQWKDAQNPLGSENHFGLINRQAQAKYALWDLVDDGVFDGISRGGSPITKTFAGDKTLFLKSVLEIPAMANLGNMIIPTVNDQRDTGEAVTEGKYIIIHDPQSLDDANDISYPSAALKLIVWESTCEMSLSADGSILVSPGAGDWWGCGLEIQAGGIGEDLSAFRAGSIHFDIRGDTKSPFVIGLQSGLYTAGTQINSQIAFGETGSRQLGAEWKTWSIPMAELVQRADLSDVTSVLFLRGVNGVIGKKIEVKNLYLSQD